jgi:hypothetical protein
MTELVIKNNIEKKKMEGLLLFLKSWDIEVEIKPAMDDNCHEIIVPSFVNHENIQRIIDLMVYKEATARSQATQDEVDSIAKEAKKDWWRTNKNRFIK